MELLQRAATNLRDRLLIRLLSRLGCRISEALALTAGDIDFQQGTVTIERLKTRLKITCPVCNAGLGRSHVFCPKCGVKVEKAVTRAKEHRRVRTLPVDLDTLEMLRDYIKRGGPVSRGVKQLLFGVNRHQAWRDAKQACRRGDKDACRRVQVIRRFLERAREERRDISATLFRQKGEPFLVQKQVSVPWH